MENGKSISTDQILSLLPHRHPFVLIDQVTDYELGKSIIGSKNVTYNEWYFEGLPAGLRIVPASILSEAIAQLGALLVALENEVQGKLIYFSGLDKVRFRKPVRPGDTLVMKAVILRRKGRVGRLSVEARVSGGLAFEGIMQFAME
ncbi:MAG TPA: 3-hydroxyacyl-ACP dehydratase FabZ [Acidobacteriota bacterium]|nr:3-hydroxyacyl-ACP dehydratase FabZ [Acidobacteriota bacterium]